MENQCIEYEICKREANTAKRNYMTAIILSASWIIISFMINCLMGLILDAEIFAMFDGGLYWIGFGNMILGLVLALVFLILHLLPSRKIVLVLTNKRIYLSISRKVFFRRTLDIVENHNLNKIVSYEFMKIASKKRTFSQLLLKTTASQINFIVDEEFYNKFVDAVNNAC